MACVPARIEHRVEVDPAGDLGVGANELAEVLFLLLGPQGVALHEPIRGVPLQSGLDERQQKPLAEEEPPPGLQIAQHPRRPDIQSLDEPREPFDHVVERQERVGNDHPLGRRVRDIALVPERDVLEPDLSVCAHDPREPAEPLRDDRIPLVRHRGGSLLAASERLSHLGHLRPRQVTNLEREPLDRSGDHRERSEQLRVAVSLENLRRDRLRLEAEPLAREPLELRVGRRVGSDRA